MNSSWITAPLGDVVTLAQGLCFNAKTNHLMVDQGIPLLRIADLKNNTKTKFVDADRVPKKYIANPNDIIYTRTGQVGLVFKGKVGVVHNNCFRVIPKEGIDPEYIYWFLRQPSIIHQARSLAGGAAQPDLSHAAFKSIICKFPEIKTQKSIADFLNTYDNLIENNTRRIEILEEMARRLYEEWFVHFRFPGHEQMVFKESALGQIPEGWSVGILQDVIVLQRGFDLPVKKRTPGGVPIISATGGSGTHNEPKVKGPGVVTGRSGSIGKVMYTYSDYWPLNTTLWGKSFPLGSTLFAFYTLSAIDLKGFNVGAAVPTLNRNDIHGLSVVVPSKDAINSFDQSVESIHALMETLKKKNANLRAQRDLLLPKLVSGEIDVSDISMPDDKEVEAA